MRLILQVILRVLRDFVSFVLNPVIRNFSKIGELKSPGGQRRRRWFPHPRRYTDYTAIDPGGHGTFRMDSRQSKTTAQRPRWGTPCAILCLVLLAAALAAEPADISKLPPAAARKIDFIADVQPIFAKHCVACHGVEKQKSDYRLDQKKSALTGGSFGGAIVPGKSSESKLLRYVAGLDDEMKMPPKGKGLGADEIGILRAWIEQGAPWPAEASVDATSDRPKHWSLKPLTKPAIPQVKNQAWVRTPIDAFILAKLEEQGMAPAPPADPRALIRRVYFDLIGLPPTAEEVEDFAAKFTHSPTHPHTRSQHEGVRGWQGEGVKRTEESRASESDTHSPTHPLTHSQHQGVKAYEALVDKLLASPRYGERWARHWMDVVHFAETHGHDQDRPRPAAWPYRDYLIRAFNDDKPYTRFIEDQVAGDVLHPDDPWATAALGMIAAGPWDESSQMGIQDGTVDKKIAQYLDRDDMIATTISSFNSVTIHCARCHHHKFDPISLEDYYALQAVFAGVDRANRSFEPDAKASSRRSELVKEKAKLAGNVANEELFSAANLATVAEWEKTVASAAVTWHVLDPSAFTSAGGATLTKQSDGSILSGGTRPEKDTYTITATTKLKSITGIRLEVLSDESLPHKGPGRQDNGNLHLSEFRVQEGSAEGTKGQRDEGTKGQDNNPHSTSPNPKSEIRNPKSLPLRSAVADWNQEGWGVARAIDGKAETAWGIYPKVGQSHHAIFDLEKPTNAQGEEITLIFTLDQLHGGGHLIGRPRLSVTSAPKPAQAASIPGAIAAILATAPEKRSVEQKRSLALHVLRSRNDSQLAALPAPQFVYAAAATFPVDGNFKPAGKPREVFVLRRGDIHQPIGPASPGSMSCVTGPEPRFKLANVEHEGERRAALATWISHRDNVLTWRSIVNRVWHYHFGRGIVDSPNDLGRMGGTPTHPQLLDYLAVTFRDDYQGSLKKLHRLIVTSSAYMQSTRHDEKFAAIDADNRLLWRMNRLRLDAEQTRDAMLAISGKLDLTMYGPSVKQFIERPGVHVTPVVDYAGFDVDHPNQFRRSVYRFVFRTLPDPLMDALDCPDLSQLSPKRSVSVTAQQALEMLNNRFMVRQCEHIAARVAGEGGAKREEGGGSDLERQVQRVYALALGRVANKDELAAVTAYANKHGLANAVRVLINSNEFLFLN